MRSCTGILSNKLARLQPSWIVKDILSLLAVSFLLDSHNKADQWEENTFYLVVFWRASKRQSLFCVSEINLAVCENSALQKESTLHKPIEKSEQ